MNSYCKHFEQKEKEFGDERLYDEQNSRLTKQSISDKSEASVINDVFEGDESSLSRIFRPHHQWPCGHHPKGIKNIRFHPDCCFGKSKKKASFHD